MSSVPAVSAPGTKPPLSTVRVLLVEDDERLARFTSEYLERYGVLVTRVADGNEGLAEALRRPYDALLLDLTLPGRDGLEVCRGVRARTDVPILILTARGEEADKVLGLELGADDYLAKPFSARELLARVHALVRRARGHAGPQAEMLECGELQLDTRSFTATLAGKPLGLTHAEFSLLKVLMERAGRVLSREQLLELAHGSADDAFDRSIDVHVSRLRSKLGDDPRHPRMLRTVRGAGYLFMASPEDAS